MIYGKTYKFHTALISSFFSKFTRHGWNFIVIYDMGAIK